MVDYYRKGFKNNLFVTLCRHSDLLDLYAGLCLGHEKPEYQNICRGSKKVHKWALSIRLKYWCAMLGYSNWLAVLYSVLEGRKSYMHISYNSMMIKLSWWNKVSLISHERDIFCYSFYLCKGLEILCSIFTRVYIIGL